MDMTLDANWYRFSRYEVRDGYIRPVEGARGRGYDPWEAYREARRGGPGEWRRPAQGPHEELLRLVDRLELRPAERSTLALSPESEAQLLAWCNRHGLLGMLPHCTIMATVHEEPRGEPLHPSMVWSLERQYLWRGNRWAVLWHARSWMRHGETLVPFDPHPEATPALSLPPPPQRQPEGVLGLGRSLPPAWPRPQALVITDLTGGDLRLAPLGLTWGRFFPDVPSERRETFDYPLPLTKSFWQQYSEPVEDFVEGALALHRAARGLAASSEEERRGGHAALDALLAPVGVAAAEEDGSLCWASRSLLATFAMMVDQDRRAGRRPLTCAVCGGLFLSAVDAARYCSETCRSTAQKRRWRKRQRRPRRRRAPERTSGVTQ